MSTDETMSTDELETNGHAVQAPAYEAATGAVPATGVDADSGAAALPYARQGAEAGATGAATAGLSGAWSAVVEDVRTLGVDLAEVGFEVARQIPRPSIPAISRPELPALPQLPALDQLQDGWTRAQDALAREVKSRLDRLDEPDVHPHAARQESWRSPAALLDDLLAAEPDARAGRDELYRALLLRLVPDEARVLGVLARGRALPLLHVQTRSRTVLAYASPIGELAGLAVPEAAGTYLAHLVTLGLAEEGAEDDALADEYERLATDPRVRSAEDTAREDGRLGSRVTRRTLRISPLGAALWSDCRTEPTSTPAEPAA
jgi:hypothetical protein